MMEIEFKTAVRLAAMLFLLFKVWNFFITKEAGGLWKRLLPEAKKKLTETVTPSQPDKTEPFREKRSETGIVGKSHTVYLDEPVVASNEPTMAIHMKPAQAPKHDTETENEVGDTVYGRQDEALDEEDRFTPFDENATDHEFSSGKTFVELSNVVDVLKGKEKSEEKRFDAADTLHGIGHTAFFKFVSTQIANTETIKKLFDDFPESDGYSPKRRKSKVEKFDMNDYV